MTEQEPEPAIGSPQWEAERLAGQMLAQDVALKELRRKNAGTATAAWDPEADERRNAALQQAYDARGAQRMGRDAGGEAMVLPGGQLVAVRRKDGMIAEMAPGVLRQVVVRPHEWDEYDWQWRTRVRLTDCTTLAQYWGRDLCLAEGWITEAEAAELPPGRPPNPNGPPYNVALSVRLCPGFTNRRTVAAVGVPCSPKVRPAGVAAGRMCGKTPQFVRLQWRTPEPTWLGGWRRRKRGLRGSWPECGTSMPGHDDVTMDGLALIEAVHVRDLEGGRVLLDNGNTRLLSAFLARVCCDLIEGWLDDDPAAFTALREHYTPR